jgi:Ca2+-binding EF-hand superfamily protein
MSTLEELKEAFWYFDHDADGYLTQEEFRHIIGHLGETLPEHEVLQHSCILEAYKRKIEEYIKEADPNNSGKIEWQGFAEQMWNAIKQAQQNQ